MDTGDHEVLVHDLKIRLTAISGYAQMVERQVARDGNASMKQRMYLTKLRRQIEELIISIHEYELELTKSPGSDDESDSTGGDLRIISRAPEC